ncbi:MAG: LysR family transcriptional regulator [Rhodospirillales bacterium]|jgi:DNA-binding transcriptional LysR family regulator|nr:LysR family transcriptional regulator [Rhodospirillales bacterium]MBT4006303.1 LysR family transcriptional regulator [Rhodospirillales bacterium]MBT5112954.1 LysR family transcriptional regulator [Rhodospirillales bacterium]MBT5672830.1 LysR family transcriptional regulator [Rhodospirillales bacterium]MBT6187507.1 LysR family transcriptional regulator [Rhodospirillales bacterium]
MDRFHAVQVFVKVADCGGFAAAARDLSISPPAVTRAVALLEDRLGTRLFVRTTRSVRLTESGERFLADGRRILLELEEAEEAAVGIHAAPRGELRITAPVLFGRIYVTPILGDYLDCYPMVNIQTLFVDRVVSLMDEGLEIAIRIGELPDSSLTAIRVGLVRRVMFASPEYIKTNGLPKRPEDIANHQLIKSTSVETSQEWAFQENGVPLSVRAEPRLRMNTNDAVIELALRGWGISRLMSYQVAPYLADGRLRAILEPFEMPPMQVHVIHQEGRMVSAKVRSFVDFMVERLRANAALNE